MPIESVQAQAVPNPAVTSTATVVTAPAVVSAPERVEPAVVSGDFLKSLSKADQKALTASIRNAIPRDSKGKAIAPAKTETAPVADPELTQVETPAAEVAAPVEDAPAVDPEPEPTAIAPALEVPAADPELDPDGKLPQHRIRARDSFDDLVMRRYNNGIRDGNAISMEACIAAEKAAQGILAPLKPIETPASKTIEAAQAELATLREQRKAAKIAYDTDAEDTAQTAIEGKLLEIERLERQAEQSTIQKRQGEIHQRQTAWQASQDQAMALYPDIIPNPQTKTLSENGKRLSAAKDRLFDEHKSANDPIQSRSDYPLLLLKLAAAEEGIAPASKKAAPATPKPVSTRSVTPAKPAPPLASASARTTPNGTGKPPVAELLPSLNMRDAKKVNQLLSSHLKR